MKFSFWEKSKITSGVQFVIAYLGTIRDINWGGCGIAALAIYNTAFLYNLKPKIHYLYYDNNHPLKEANDNFKKGKTSIAHGCTHVVVKIGNKFYDANGEYDLDSEGYVDGGEVTKEHLINSVVNGEWNSMFNRGKWLPKIEEFMGYKLIEA